MTYPLDNGQQLGVPKHHGTILEIQGGMISYSAELEGNKFLREAQKIDKLFEKAFETDPNSELTIILGKNSDGREYKALVETEGHLKKIVIYSRNGDGEWKVPVDTNKEPLNIQQVLPDIGYEQDGELYTGLLVVGQKTSPSFDGHKITLKGKQTIYLKRVAERGRDFSQADIGKAAGGKKPAGQQKPPAVHPPHRPKITQVKVNEKGDDDIIPQELLKAMGVGDTDGDKDIDVYDLDTNKDGLISWKEVKAANIGISIGLYNVIFDNMNAEAFSAKEPMGECDYGKFREFGKTTKKFANITNRGLDEAVTLYKKCQLANVNLDELATAKGNIIAALKAQLKGAKLTPKNLATVLKNCGYKPFVIAAMVKEFAHAKEITPEMVAAQILDSIMGSGFSKKVQKKYWKIVHPLSKPFPFKTCNLNAENIENFITGQKMTEKSAEEAEGSESAGTASPSRLRGMTNRQLWVEKQKLEKAQEADMKKFEELIEAGKGIFVMDGKLPKIEGGEVVLTPVAQGDPEAKKAADKYIRMLKRLRDRQGEIGFINFRLSRNDVEPMYKLAYGKYQEVLDDDKAPTLDKAYAHLLKAGSVQELMKEEVKKNPQKYVGIDSKDENVKKEVTAKLAMAIQPQIKENLKAAKKLLEDKYFDNGQLKADVPKGEKAIVLYLYAQALVNSAEEKDKGAANIKSVELIQEAGKYAKDIPDYHPLKERIVKRAKDVAEKTKDLNPGQMVYEKVMNDPEATLAQKVEAEEKYAALLKTSLAEAGAEVTERTVKMQLAYIRSLSRTMDFVELEKAVTTLLDKYKEIPEDLQPAAKEIAANTILGLLGGGLYSGDLASKLFEKYTAATSDKEIKLANKETIDKAKIDEIVKNRKDYKGTYPDAMYNATQTGRLLGDLAYQVVTLGSEDKKEDNVTEKMTVARQEEALLRAAFILKKHEKDTKFFAQMKTWATRFYHNNKKDFDFDGDAKAYDPRNNVDNYEKAMAYLSLLGGLKK